MKKILFFLLTVCLLSSCGRRHSKDTFYYSEKDLFNRYLLSKHYAAKLKKTYEEASDQFFADVDRELVVIEVLFRRIKREVQEIEDFREDFSSVAFQLIEMQYSLEKRIAAIEKKLGIKDTAEEDAAPDATPENGDTTSTDDAPAPVVTAESNDTASTDAPVVTETVPADDGTVPATTADNDATAESVVPPATEATKAEADALAPTTESDAAANAAAPDATEAATADDGHATEWKKVLPIDRSHYSN